MAKDKSKTKDKADKPGKGDKVKGGGKPGKTVRRRNRRSDDV